MKQVFLSGVGRIDVLDVPIPGRVRGGVLVRNAFSLISAGTEGAAVTKNKGIHGVYEKLMNSRNRAGQVWDIVQSQGLSSAKQLIQNKLEDSTPIGYSCAGVVVECDEPDLGFSPGDRVVCMGTGFANHSEYVAVPRNLVAHIPDGVKFEHASFGALACIAMQGVRRLELTPGERVCIVGLGLIGELAIRLATAMGYEVYGVDVDERRCEHARAHSGARGILNPGSRDAKDWAHELTDGHGFDGVVICASAPSDSVVNAAFETCRTRGRVSVVGDIGLGLERAKMYAKELELRLSCSYGVGRYDSEYEIDGVDYRLAHARWTEGRNLDYFVRLLGHQKLDIADLVTRAVPVAEASQAYDTVKDRSINSYGVVIDHGLPESVKAPQAAYLTRYDQKTAPREVKQRARIGLVGVGAYAKNVHVPNIEKLPNMDIHAIASRSGGSAAVVARKVGAQYATSDTARLLEDDEIDGVLIATRHASHGKLTKTALEAKKHIYVEKPMATSIDECCEIVEASRKQGRVLRVGFNRRFSPWLLEMKHAIPEGPRMLTIRVNVGNIGSHWSNSAGEGGRLLGEGVHFFDVANWMFGCRPRSVTATCLGEADSLNPNVMTTIQYEDGSVANVVYCAVGDGGLGKEYYELFGNGRAVCVNDFREIRSSGCRVRAPRNAKGDKGQLDAMREFGQAMLGGSDGGGADALAGLWATAITKAAYESARERKTVELGQFIESERTREQTPCVESSAS